VPHGFDRRLRVADLMRHEIGKLLISQSHDPRFKFVSVSEIEISKDYANAKVYVTMLNDDQITETLAALNKAAGYFRRELAQAINLRSTPKLHFHYDDSIRRGRRIADLLSKTSNNSESE
jgi:ribosome-binding factor A